MVRGPQGIENPRGPESHPQVPRLTDSPDVRSLPVTAFRLALAAALAVLLLARPAVAADFSVKVEGLEGQLLENVNAQLASMGIETITVQGRYRARVRTGVRTGLRALGYYDPKLKFSWGPEPAAGSKKPRELVVRVTPGEPVRIAGAELVLTGDAREDRDFEALKADLPKNGTVLNHGDYEAFKKKVQSLATRKGYFQGRFVKNELGVSASRREAYWRLAYDSGRRWRFGEVTFTGSQIDDELLQNIVPFEPGEPYSAPQLAKLNERLADSGWFNSAVVAPNFREADRENAVVPMAGNVTPRSANIVEVGIGYSTDVGPRFRGDWEKPWVNERGHSLTFATELSAKEQEADASYKIPVADNPLQEYWLGQWGLKRTDLNDTQSTQTTLAGTRFWKMEDGWQRSAGLHWMLDNFTQGETSATTMVVYPSIGLSRTRSRGGAMPTWGDSQRYSVDVAHRTWGSDVNFWSFNAQGVLIRTLQARHRFVGRYAFGWISSADFDEVPPDLRFFAGGDRSIRGYDYKSISPRDDSGELRGAKRMVTASLEYQYNVTGPWWAAIFVDSGEAVDSLSPDALKTGAGVGIRWQSPVGPVKFDIARPVDDPDHRGFAFYIGLGPEL